jgi:hypothetical protein
MERDEGLVESEIRGTPRVVDEATYQEYAREILATFRVAVDCVELLRLASRAGDVACQHVDALRRVARDWVALIVRHRAERARLLGKRVAGMPHSYATLADDVEQQHRDGHAPFRATRADLLSRHFPPFLYWETLSFKVEREGEPPRTVYRLVSEAIRVDVQRRVVDEEEEQLLTLLRRIRHEEPTRRDADTALIRVARNVADWTKGRGKIGQRADWMATAMILECHGWLLPGASLSQKAARLENRVTKDEARRATKPPD